MTVQEMAFALAEKGSKIAILNLKEKTNPAYFAIGGLRRLAELRGS